MRFGANTFLVTSPFTTDQSGTVFPLFKKWGFDSVEIALEDPAHIDPVRVKEALDKFGLAASSLCACLGPGRDLRGSVKDQQAALKYLKACIDYAVVLGSNTVIGPVYSCVGRAEPVPPGEYQRQWRTVVRHLKTLGSYAAARGKKICLEPLNRFETDFINTCDQGLKMVRDVGSPGLGLMLDTFHMNIEEKCLGDAIRKAGNRLGHLHACGSDRGTPGGDHTNWDCIASALKAIGYKGDVVIESFTPEAKVVAKAASIWRKIEPSPRHIAVNGLKFLKEALR